MGEQEAGICKLSSTLVGESEGDVKVDDEINVTCYDIVNMSIGSDIEQDLLNVSSGLQNLSIDCGTNEDPDSDILKKPVSRPEQETLNDEPFILATPVQLKTEKPRLIRKNPNILRDFLKISTYAQENIENWCNQEFNNPCMLINLDPYSPEFYAVYSKFSKTMLRYYSVTGIFRIENPFNLAHFTLKKHQIFERFGKPRIASLFHATHFYNCPSICEENFNWRFAGTSRGHIFGQGVSFSPRSNYARNFSKTHLKVMFITDVLKTKYCIGNNDMVVPPEPFDTSIKKGGDVVVKYEDHEFYPKYAIHFF